MTTQVRSYAKINWSLRILGRRPDGYHDLETVFQTVSLHDTLTFTKSPELLLTCDDPLIPTDDSNLVIRAARVLGVPPVAIDLRKSIPAGGGLGGGSSNAAATLMTLARMFAMDDRELPDMALHLGSDVPFFLIGGTAYATGRGEELRPLRRAASIPMLLLFPPERVSTPEAFGLIRRYTRPLGAEHYAEMADGDLLDHGAELTNDFEEPVFSRLPHLRELKERLLASGAAWAGMSGSGSTIAGAFRSVATRDDAVSGFSEVRLAKCETT